ncbi:Fur family transcriptional regulator [Pseudodesulfovibrio thermohalotolerans]|uniref:Fur family transcriptional regulator n=1 Tax=Pseudodesulfovibrio thermohalotolerans TaxID=2880651 RepID=UPI0024411A44|nr:Fur family transcriptional regulator [Pseudodesulfovibrio thermohalotolerans]WFS61631.1 Fur family transcriptional regulator [Pseudodesulfovibrio thermohalotolerans]
MSISAEQFFLNYLEETGLNMTPQRMSIVQTFLEAEGHFSADRLCELVREKAPEIGQATVYRTLKLLIESGLADTIDGPDGGGLYERAYGRAHHDHLMCLKCKRKVEIFDPVIEERQEQIAREHGFTLTRHRMYLYGLCPDCASDD